jgi:protein ImuA
MMSSARLSALAALRGRIERMETHAPHLAALGHVEADAVLQGGLATAAVHEVFCESHQSATATGFVAGLARCVAPRRPLVWVRQDFSEREIGALSMSGLAELGLDPRYLVTVRAPDVENALRTAADALACDAVGAMVLEVWGETQKLDLVGSRKLTLAAQGAGVTGFLLRIAASPIPSSAETRWIVRAAHSPPLASWDGPLFDAELVRNRHGALGRWIMEWSCDECVFKKPAADSQPLAAAPGHRSHQAPARLREKLAS